MKLETVVFYPHESEFDVESAGAFAPAQSTADRLVEYNQQLKDNLNAGLYFTEVLDTLIKTDDVNELLKAVQILASYQLDSSYLVYPLQYSRADFYLIFVNRLLGLHEDETIILQSSEQKQSLYHEFPGINDRGIFKFAVNPANNQQAFYVEEKTGLRLFFIDFEKKQLYFNSQDLTKLLLVNYRDQVQKHILKHFERYLVALGQYLQADYGYEVDFNFFDATYDKLYQMQTATDPDDALDKLFVKSSQAGLMLISGMNGEAVLKLKGQVVLTLFNKDLVQDTQPCWVMKVDDPDNQVSLFDLLVDNDFLVDWYLENENDVQIRCHEVFMEADDK